MKLTFQVQVLIDLGNYTPDSQTNEVGDHTLVLVFQPFRGQWIQPLGCFLSKDVASGSVFHYLILSFICIFF